jgi:hypothetical protein
MIDFTELFGRSERLIWILKIWLTRGSFVAFGRLSCRAGLAEG